MTNDGYFYFGITMALIVISLILCGIFYNLYKASRRKNWKKAILKAFPEFKKNPDNYVAYRASSSSARIVKLTKYLESLYKDKNKLENELDELKRTRDETEPCIEKGANPFLDQIVSQIKEHKGMIKKCKDMIWEYEHDEDNYKEIDL